MCISWELEGVKDRVIFLDFDAPSSPWAATAIRAHPYPISSAQLTKTHVGTAEKGGGSCLWLTTHLWLAASVGVLPSLLS